MCQYGGISDLLFGIIKSASFFFVQYLVYVELEVGKHVSLNVGNSISSFITLLFMCFSINRLLFEHRYYSE